VPRRHRRRGQRTNRKVGFVGEPNEPRTEAPTITTPLFIAGAMTGLACLTHPIATAFLIGIFGLVMLEGAISLVVFAAGGAVVVAVWLAVIMSAGPDYLTALIHHAMIRSSQGPVATRVVTEVHRWATDFIRMPTLFVGYLVGVWALSYWANNRRVRFELLFLGSVCLLLNTFFMSKSSGYYPLYPQLFFSLLAAGSLAATIAGGTRPQIQSVGALLCVIVVVQAPIALVPRLVASIKQRDARDYAPVAERLNVLIPAGSTVWSVPEGWYALAEHGSVRTPSLDYNPAPNPDVDDYAVARMAYPIQDSRFLEIARIGEPVPLAFGRTFATTDYQLIVYHSKNRIDRRTDSPEPRR
jgi:hypothetical protein